MGVNFYFDNRRSSFMGVSPMPGMLTPMTTRSTLPAFGGIQRVHAVIRLDHVIARALDWNWRHLEKPEKPA
jgi:hypothetical protein